MHKWPFFWVLPVPLSLDRRVPDWGSARTMGLPVSVLVVWLCHGVSLIHACHQVQQLRVAGMVSVMLYRTPVYSLVVAISSVPRVRVPMDGKHPHVRFGTVVSRSGMDWRVTVPVHAVDTRQVQVRVPVIWDRVGTYAIHPRVHHRQ